MKTVISCIWACLLSLIVIAQEKPVKIVFDVTSGDTKVHQAAVRHVKAMSEAYPNSQFEVVMYSGAMDMVLKDKSVVADDVAKLVQKDNIDFVICQGTMKRHNTKDEDLIKGVKQVPDGILEIVSKQKEGWGYIKESQ
ncbi:MULTISPECIES: DsrE family protein [Aestuariibaculum]|uniref:DsrE family protein n=1 Tax=Aestuariibaculum lutulentum TaxID=2920935 RepID=A0ABS9RKP2_9FLAO|nr:MULTISPECIES: DsrE family protein [Aestuariibaculum]MCH4553477.1 DsrE family protein [Aestuariibaculum lutulentum]MCR8667921.1 DsrE family protein [Aestuariibaculum sp. M13]